MGPDTAVDEPRTRPRVEGEREREIYAVVVDLLAGCGYDKLTFDAVATAARASKATLYRKWPGKAELVVDAVSFVLACDRKPVDTGTLRGDLLAAACQQGGLGDNLATVIGSVLPALHRDPELHRAFHERFMEPKLAAAVEMFERARARGEIGPCADTRELANILPALCTHDTFVSGTPTTPEAIAHKIDTIVLPACRATLDDS